MEAPLEPMKLPLDECMETTWWKQSSCNRSNTLTCHTGDNDQTDRWHTEPRNGSKPLENLPNAFSSRKQAQPPPPCWQRMDQAQNAKNAT
jgi:hypothetical protein